MGLVVGIGGVSRAGKTTLAKMISEWFSSYKSITFPMDKYVKNEEEIPKIKNLTDWEIPESVDYPNLISIIKKKRSSVDLVIVEGILIYNYPGLWELMDVKLFIDIPEKEFYSRRLRDKRWMEPDWFLDHVWNSFVIHGTIHQENCIHINGTEIFEKDKIEKFIKL